MFPVSLNYTRGPRSCCPRWEGRALPQPLLGPCSGGIWKGSTKIQENPLYITVKWTWVSPSLILKQHLLQRLPLEFRGSRSIQISRRSWLHVSSFFCSSYFLTKCKISLSFHNPSLFFPFFSSPFSFFSPSLFNRFVFRSIRLVITRTQSSIFLLLERLLQCDGQIVRNNYTKWWKKKWRERSLPPSDTFYLRHSEHQAHSWQGETGKWSFATGLFLIAAEPIRQHKMLHKPQTHTKPNNVDCVLQERSRWVGCEER